MVRSSASSPSPRSRWSCQVPDTFVVLRAALADGPRAGTWAAAARPPATWCGAPPRRLGVAALLAASGSAFAVLKLVGAAYLVFLGLQALGAAARGDSLAADAADGARSSRGGSASVAAWRATCST